MDHKDFIVQKPWGSEYLCYRNPHLAVWVLNITQGERTSMHCHPKKNTALIVLSGSVQVSFIRSGQVFSGLDKINVVRGRFHSTRALSPAVLLEVEAPDDKEDLVRLEDAYGRSAQPYEGKEAMRMREADCLWLGHLPTERWFAGCTLRIFTPKHQSEVLMFDDQDVLVTLQGGLERGLLPPGEAIDGDSLRRIAGTFAPQQGSMFLHIRKRQ